MLWHFGLSQISVALVIYTQPRSGSQRCLWLPIDQGQSRSPKEHWMKSMYRAMEITSPGVFSLVERTIPVPGAGQVRIRVEACGVCHSDAATVEAQFPNLSYPRVPGHEVIGRIEEVGPGVTAWKVDQRVGVGFFGGEDGTCEACRRGETAYCQNAIMTGITTDGGYAETMIAEARALALIPDALKSEDAAPLVCAGITSFIALPNTARAGDTVAIQGVGGLAHRGDWWGPRQRAPGAEIRSAHLHRCQGTRRGGSTAKARRRRCHPCDRAKRGRNR